MKAECVQIKGKSGKKPEPVTQYAKVRKTEKQSRELKIYRVETRFYVKVKKNMRKMVMMIHI